MGRRRAERLKAPLDLLATSSLVIPAVLAGLAYLLLYLALNGLPLYGTLLGVTLAFTYRVAIPYRLANAALLQIGRDMEGASATSGASPTTTMLRVTAPMMAPAALVAWSVFFFLAVRETSLMRILGFNGPTLASFDRNAPTAVLSILLVLGIIALLRGAALRLIRR